MDRVRIESITHEALNTLRIKLAGDPAAMEQFCKGILSSALLIAWKPIAGRHLLLTARLKDSIVVELDKTGGEEFPAIMAATDEISDFQKYYGVKNDEQRESIPLPVDYLCERTGF